MSYDDYIKAQKAGKKDYQRHLAMGSYPYLQALEESISHVDIVSEVSLGLTQIPSELIRGTRSTGRRTAFAPNFMPLLDSHSEFAAKWISLCSSHIQEGIHDPVTACEFMGRFYIMEGNKRVSVFKYFDAPFIPAHVTRLLPRRTDDPSNLAYYEYVDFHNLTGVNYIMCRKAGNFSKILTAVTGDPEKVWDEETRMDFSAAYVKFKNAYLAKGGGRLSVTFGDALLSYITVCGFDTLKRESPAEVRDHLDRIWEEFRLLEEGQAVELLMDPSETQDAPVRKKLISILIPPAQKQLKIGFIHSKDAAASSWTYAHELGRRHLEEAFPKQVETIAFDHVTAGEGATKALRDAADEGCGIIFTTTPEFIPSSLKIAADLPKVKILNCSLNTSHSLIRTYYGRMYEAKFLCGLIAGGLADNNRIGYVADYPIYGMTANINAFALGARMVNPRAQVYLKWSTVKDDDIIDYFRRNNVSYISSQDMITPRFASRQYGLYRFEPEEDGQPFNAATPLWNWGKFYEKIVQSILSGSWSGDESSDGARALNYWWGLSAGVVDIIYSQNLSSGTKRLVDFMRRGIESGSFHPFGGLLYSQDGLIQKDEDRVLPPEEIITMDWLAENIVGSIPELEMLSEEAQPVVRLQGIRK